MKWTTALIVPALLLAAVPLALIDPGRSPTNRPATQRTICRASAPCPCGPASELGRLATESL